MARVGASREAVDKLVAAARKSACSPCACTAFDTRPSSPRCETVRSIAVSTAPRSRPSRAAVPGRRHRAGRGLARRQAGAACHRRPLRLSSKEYTPRCNGARRVLAPKRSGTSCRHRRRRHAAVAEVDRRSTPKRSVTRACLRLGATARWGDQEHVKIIGENTAARQATSSTTARSPARSPSLTCASAQAIESTYLIDRATSSLPQFEFMESSTCWRARQATFLLNSPTARSRCGATAREAQDTILAKKLKFSPSPRPTARGKRPGWRRITP